MYVLVWYNNSGFTPLGYLLKHSSVSIYLDRSNAVAHPMKINILLFPPLETMGQES